MVNFQTKVAVVSKDTTEVVNEIQVYKFSVQIHTTLTLTLKREINL